MDLIFFDSDFREIGPAAISADFELGDESTRNDFEVLSGNVYGYGMYIPGTEAGGAFEYSSTVYGENPTIKGFTWRGLLTQGVIEPPIGSDYKTVSGDANQILQNLLQDFLGGFFTVPGKESGLYLNDYQFRLHCTYLEGISNMLSENGYKLLIYAKKSDELKRVVVYAEAVPVETLIGEYDDDSDVKLQLIDNQMGINHLICLGKGELKDRQRIDLYLQEDGSVGSVPFFVGFHERTAIYDYSSAESLKTLKSYGTRRLKEISSKKSLKILSERKELQIGDIVKGRYRAQNVTVEAPVYMKIYRVNDDNVDIEYKIKEDA